MQDGRTQHRAYTQVTQLTGSSINKTRIWFDTDLSICCSFAVLFFVCSAFVLIVWRRQRQPWWWTLFVYMIAFFVTARILRNMFHQKYNSFSFALADCACTNFPSMHNIFVLFVPFSICKYFIYVYWLNVETYKQIIFAYTKLLIFLYIFDRKILRSKWIFKNKGTKQNIWFDLCIHFLSWLSYGMCIQIQWATKIQIKNQKISAKQNNKNNLSERNRKKWKNAILVPKKRNVSLHMFCSWFVCFLCVSCVFSAYLIYIQIISTRSIFCSVFVVWLQEWFMHIWFIRYVKERKSEKRVLFIAISRMFFS